VVSAAWFSVLIGIVAAERGAELAVAQRNLAWSRARGGRETGLAHYPFMVFLHVGFLVGCLIEVWVGHRGFVGWLGWPMLVLVVVSQVLRWWCISTLGRQWNTRIVVIPGLPRVTAGPYRLLAHPNYLAVVVEGIALPLVHDAWITAAAFTTLNALLLVVRIRAESTALADVHA
jgi:methyltransferase